jgi:hypothetical protein
MRLDVLPETGRWVIDRAALEAATWPREQGALVGPRPAGVGVTSGGMLAVSYYGQDVTGVALYQIENGGRTV